MGEHGRLCMIPVCAYSSHMLLAGVALLSSVGGAGVSWTTMTSLRRRLKRVSSRVSEVELKTAMVIKGGVMKEHMVLPTVTVDGKECVQICCWGRDATWLRCMLGGAAASSEYVGAIANFVLDCVHAAKVAQFCSLGGNNGVAGAEPREAGAEPRDQSKPEAWPIDLRRRRRRRRRRRGRN